METELDYELEYEPVYTLDDVLYADDDAFRLTRNQTVIDRTLFGASGYVYGEYEPQFEVIDIAQNNDRTHIGFTTSNVGVEEWTVTYADNEYKPIRTKSKRTSNDVDNIPLSASDELDEHLKQFSVRG